MGDPLHISGTFLFGGGIPPFGNHELRGHFIRSPITEGGDGNNVSVKMFQRRASKIF